MISVSCADETVVFHVRSRCKILILRVSIVPSTAKRLRYLEASTNAVAEGLRLHSCRLGSLLDFQTVFVRAGVEIRRPSATP